MELKRPDALLLDCLRADSPLSGKSGLEGLTPSDWREVVGQAMRHKIAPYLYLRLKNLRLSELVPREIMVALREFFFRSAARNLRLYSRLSKVLGLLKDEDISVIVLKGAYLDEAVYQRIGTRAFNDVDLLFRKGDLLRCQKKLMHEGYYPIQDNLPLDIHWDFDLAPSPVRVDMRAIWKRARPDIIADVPVQVLSPEDLIIHLCLHLAVKNLFEYVGLRTFCDIREIIERYHGQLKWDDLAGRVGEWGAGNGVYLTLLLARELLNAHVPDSLLKMLRPEDLDPSVRDWALDQIFWSRGSSLSLSPYFWQLWQPCSLREKTAHFLKLIYPPREYVSREYPAPYGSSRNYFYYLVRVKDHFSRYVRAVWRMVIRDEKMLSLAERQRKNSAIMEWLSSSPGT